MRTRFSLAYVGLPILLLLASTARSQADQDVRTLAARIDALVAPQEQAQLVSGVILVARGDQVLVRRSYGFANWELRVPNSLSTRFGIGSITKPMTEILIRLLANAGRIDLEAPVEKYLPGFPKGPQGGIPTVRQLLNHRAGVPHRVTDPADEAQPLRPSDIVQRVQATGLLFEPGARRLYSSAGYTCLASVIEVVEKKPFETVLAERVFGPAGMTGAVSETGPRLMLQRAMPYRLGAHESRIVVKSAPYKDLRFLTGAGSVYSTAEDLMVFVQALRSGVFGKDLWDETFSEDPTRWNGWTGRTNGYEASVDVLPAEHLTFVFLSNLQSAANWRIREQVQNLLLGRDTAGIPLLPAVAEPFEDPRSLVGSYGPAEVAFVDGQLFRGENEFYPISGRKYYIPASGSTMRFRRNSAGVVIAIISDNAGGRETVLPKSAGH